MAEYYFLSGEEVRGPFGLADFFLLVKQGTLHAASQVCQAGSDEWRLLGSFPEFAATSQPMTGPTPPPLSLAHARRSAVFEEEALRDAYRAKRRLPSRTFCWAGAMALAIGVVAAMNYASQPSYTEATTPGWPYALCLVGLVIFVVGRLVRPGRE